MQITIRGMVPIPQGSLKAVNNERGRSSVPHMYYTNKEQLDEWRNAIRTKLRRHGAEPSVGPMVVSIVFGMPRPKAHMYLRGGKYEVRPEYASTRPDTMPDLDKLIRAVLDALTGLCYLDDAQVVSIMARKEYGDTTIIGVSGARRQDQAASDQWTQDALGLVKDQASDIAEGQLHMSALQDAGS